MTTCSNQVLLAAFSQHKFSDTECSLGVVQSSKCTVVLKVFQFRLGPILFAHFVLFILV